MAADRRPDPDALLALTPRADAQPRGRLKIFLGAAPGVGKTFTMLEAARQQRAEGVDVLLGVIETHGRKETAALAEGLPALPLRRAVHRGTTIEEFDLDGALERRPGLLLLDELAHTNVPGSRHAKRYLDVEELRRAGINVYGTLNIQHLESLNDVVAQITGITVRETVPDALLDEADEIELVDVSPEVLEQRLLDGKVYVPEQARRALERFFRRGNLIALREMALRRAAERVDAQMRGWRAAAGVAEPWAASERLLVCVSPSERTLRLVRTARRLAALLQAPWTAIYVSLPGHATLPAARRDAAQEALRLAEELGGTAVTIPGHDAVEEILAWARQHNVTRVLVGTSRRRRLGSLLLPFSIPGRLIRRARGLHVWIGADAPAPENAAPEQAARRFSPWPDYAWAAGYVLLVTAVALPFQRAIAEIDAAMIYLLAVVVASARHGRGPSALAAVLAVALFDLSFVPPFGRFSVSDIRFVLTFAVMLVVALTMGGLTTRVREQAETARERERRTSTLYAVSRDLAGARLRPDLARVMLRHLYDLVGGRVTLLLPDESGTLQRIAETPPGGPPDVKDLGVARWVFDHGEAAGLGTSTLPAADALFLPLRTPERVLGVVGVRAADALQRPLVEAVLDQAAVALERTELAEATRRAHLEVESERLRTALLSSLSHDLRTPLAGIEGAASTLLDDSRTPLSSATRRDLAATIVGEAQRMTRLIGNLLDMVRVESGALAVQREWHVLEEIVGVALLRVEDRLAGRTVTTHVSSDLPLVPVDDLLIEQVLINLLENAARHTPPGSPIDVSAQAGPGQVLVTVADRGAGVPAEERERIFEKFHRATGGAGGIGLGLAICRGIVTAHGGRIWVEPREGGGAAFRFVLPLVGAPPRPLQAAT